MYITFLYAWIFIHINNVVYLYIFTFIHISLFLFYPKLYLWKYIYFELWYIYRETCKMYNLKNVYKRTRELPASRSRNITLLAPQLPPNVPSQSLPPIKGTHNMTSFFLNIYLFFWLHQVFIVVHWLLSSCGLWIFSSLVVALGLQSVWAL